jgi:hypothetical protein
MEGSVVVDEGGFSASDTNNVGDDNASENTSVDTKDTESSDDGEGEKVKLTEKGTKLDPNPLSAAHQELANERKVRQEYEQILRNPEILKKYAKEAGISLSEAKEEIKEESKKFSADRFKTADDVASVFNELTERMESLVKENSELKNNFSGFAQSREVERVANNLQSDSVKVKNLYKELDKESDQYNESLDKRIAARYHKLDFDEKTGSYMGKHSLADIAQDFVETYREAKGTGSKEAQTKIVEKQSGRVITSTKSASRVESESNDPGTAIAQKIYQRLHGGGSQ